MAEEVERVCYLCGDNAEAATLERCKICWRYFCTDCGHKGRGHRFCSERCSMEFIYGDHGDDDDRETEE